MEETNPGIHTLPQTVGVPHSRDTHSFTNTVYTHQAGVGWVGGGAQLDTSWLRLGHEVEEEDSENTSPI